MADPLPKTLGVCPVCWPEFSMPDAKAGDTCPAGPHYSMEDDLMLDPPLAIYTRSEPKAAGDWREVVRREGAQS